MKQVCFWNFSHSLWAFFKNIFCMLAWVFNLINWFVNSGFYNRTCIFFLLRVRQVPIEEGEAKAQELGVMFIETSAKAGFNIKVHVFTWKKIIFLSPWQEMWKNKFQNDKIYLLKQSGVQKTISLQRHWIVWLNVMVSLSTKIHFLRCKTTTSSKYFR